MKVSTLIRTGTAICLILTLVGTGLLAQGRAPGQPGKRPPKVSGVYGAIPLKDKKITIDGMNSDWPTRLRGIPLFFHHQVSGGSEFRGDRDLRGRAFLCWDSENLYFLAAVTDDFLRTTGGLAGLGYSPAGPAGDGIWLKFDPRRDTRTLGNTLERKEDLELKVLPTDKGECRLYRIDRIGGTVEREKGIEAAVRIEPRKEKDPFNIWYEMKLPWTEILPKGMSPKEGLVIGMEIVLEDFDSPVDPLPQTRLGWTFASGPVLYPGNQGSLVLVKEPLPDKVSMRPAPPRPMPSKISYLGVESPELYEDLSRDISKTQPDPGPPGEKRLALLEKLDKALGAWPVLDTGQMVSLWQRGQNREFKGLFYQGVPVYLRTRVNHACSLFAEDPPGPGQVRLVRLPWSGWLIRTKFFTFAVDPFLPGLHRYGSKVDAQFLTNALDPVRRDDPLSVETFKSRVPFLAHLPAIIPNTDTSRVPLVRPGDGLNLGVAEILVLGPLGQKRTEISQLAFDIRMIPKGPRMIFGGYNFDPSWLMKKGKKKKGEMNAGKETALSNIPIHVLSLPIGHRNLAKVVKKVGPRLFLPHDVLDFPKDAKGKTDIRIKEALTRLEALKGIPWRLMTWGEKVNVYIDSMGAVKPGAGGKK